MILSWAPKEDRELTMWRTKGRALQEDEKLKQRLWGKKELILFQKLHEDQSNWNSKPEWENRGSSQITQGCEIRNQQFHPANPFPCSSGRNERNLRGSRPDKQQEVRKFQTRFILGLPQRDYLSLEILQRERSVGIKDEDLSFIKGDAWEVKFLGNQPFNLGKVSLSCLMEREGF